MKNTPFVLLTLPAALLLSGLQSQATVTYSSDTTLNTSITLTDTTDTYGVIVDSGSVLTFGSSGSIAINNNGSVSSAGIWTNGLQLGNWSSLVMQQGSITVNDLGNTTPAGEGNDALVGIVLFDNSIADIGGAASINLASNGGGRSAQLFRVGFNNSTLNISGGTFVSYEENVNASNNHAFNLGGSGNVVNISGGNFELVSSAVTGGGRFFYFEKDTHVTLSGGTFVETVGTNYKGIEFKAGVESGSFTFLGKLLELDTNQDGNFDTIISTDSSVSDLEGDFRITFQDDSTWESNYSQQTAGQINFTAIPEPSATSILIGVSALALLMRRRRS